MEVEFVENNLDLFDRKTSSPSASGKLPDFLTRLLESNNLSLPETNGKFAPENRPFDPIGKDRIPTIHFQGRTVSFRECI